MIKKGRFHPSRISNQSKMATQRAFEKYTKKNKKKKLEEVNLKNSDWSSRVNK